MTSARSSGGPSSGLSDRVVASGLWLAALAGTGRVIGLARLAILARFLGPHEFGLVGAALVVIATLEAFSDLGLYLALVQRQNTSRDLLDTAWTLGVIRGAAIAAATFVLAPWIGDAFGSQEAIGVVRAMSLVPLVGSFANVGMVEFRRELAFGRYYLIQTIAISTELLVSVPLALWLRSAWAIVAGWWALSAARVLLSYALHPYRPRLRLRRDDAHGLLSYGRWIAGSTALQWVTGEGVSAVVARWFGLEGLGLYQMAWRVTGQPAAESATLISAVTTPAYAKLSPAPERAARAYIRVLKLAGLGAIPIAVLLILYAEELVELLFGPRWQPSAGLVGILAAFAAVSLISAVTLPVFQGLGRPRDQMLVSITEILTLAVALPIGLSTLGLTGVAVATLCRAGVGAFASAFLIRRHVGVGWASLLSAVAWPLLACLPLLILRVGPFGGRLGPGLLAAGLFLSLLCYFVGILALDRVKLLDLEPLLHGAWSRIYEVLKPRQLPSQRT